MSLSSEVDDLDKFAEHERKAKQAQQQLNAIIESAKHSTTHRDALFTLSNKEIAAFAIVYNFLESGLQDIYGKVNVFTMMVDFTLLYRGEEGIENMASYLAYLDAFDKENRIYASVNVFHDLVGRGTRGFAPRTAGYNEILKKSIEKAKKESKDETFTDSNDKERGDLDREGSSTFD